MNTLSIINLLPSTREQVLDFAGEIIAKVESGEVNPLDLKAQMKFIERTLSEIDKSIKDKFIDEAAKYGKSFDYKGWRIEQVESGHKYDYSGDNEWLQLSERLKEREKFLKGLTKPMADPGTGEICHPPIKKSTSTLKFTAL